MCLILEKDYKAKVAKKDIECYKIFNIFPYENTDKLYKSLYRGTKYELGKEYNSGFTFSGIVKHPCNDGIFQELVPTVEMGLHSYAEIPSYGEYSRFTLSNLVCCRCIIPKGSTYYVGKFDNATSYASNCIKVIEEVHGVKGW